MNRNIGHGMRGGGVALSLVALVASAVGGSAVSAQGLSKTVHTIPAGFQDWVEHNHDEYHTGVSSETFLTATTAFKLHWTVNTGGTKAYSSPAVVYNTTLGVSLVYVGNQSGDFDAFNATTGKLVWKYAVPKTAGLSKEIEPSPAVYQNTVYFGDGSYHEYALNATTGALICTSGSVGGIISSSPMIGNPDGRGPVVYFGDAGPSGDSNVQDGGHLWAMYGVGNPDGAACSMRWMFDDFGSPAGSQTGKSGVYSTPAYYTFSNGVPVVVVGSTDNDDSIYEINASTGAAIWRFQTLTGEDADVGAPPTIAVPGTVGATGSAAYTDGVVYDTGKDAVVYALDLKTGAQIWSFPIRTTIHHGNPAQSGAALVGGFLYEGYGLGVFSLNAATGAPNPAWVSGPKVGTSPALTGVVSSPAVSGPAGSQVLFAGDISGDIVAISVATGKILFTDATSELIFSSAAVSTGQFFIAGGGNGDLYAFGS
jgi:outer membrane protein assembly factor BamB